MKTYTYLLALPLLIFGLLLSGCDSGGSSEIEEKPLNGTWQRINVDGSVIDDPAYLRIDLPDAEAYYDEGDPNCYGFERLRLNRISGNTFALQYVNDPAADTLSLRVQDDILTLKEVGQSGEATFRRSDVDVSTLPICGPSSD